ncbi:hypothetical protein ACFV08_02850 [Streptomyces fradiae]|uniref:hypothetical protein n=1 Tax=Streptomyces fradiae TaxID=1906 RepID=UPI0036C55230
MEITHGAGSLPLREGIEMEQRIGSWKVVMWRPVASSLGGPVEMRIEPHEDGDPQEIARGISSTVLRQVDTGAFIDALGSTGQPSDDDAEREAERLRTELAEASKRLSDRYLAMLAASYVRVVDIGERAPIQALEEITGAKQPTLKGHLRAARQRGFLTKVEGKAGGRLTEKAIGILEGMKDGEGSQEV